MGVPVSQMWTVASYVLQKKLRGEKRYPLVLMLEPLFRCNLACAGCGKIQHPVDILRKNLSVEDCMRAVDECGAPMVSIPGGEPLLHPQIEEIVQGLIDRKKYIYLCTNALLLEQRLDRFQPSKYLSFSVHIDGPREEHDEAVCREGVYEIAVRAIQKAVERGFRVTTNTTVFNNADPERMRQMFDEMTAIGVEGMMLSPGYPYEKAPDQEHFLHAAETVDLFQRMLDRPKRNWVFNQSPLFLEFLKGNWQLECTPWGNPTYNLFGWQKPCYLLQEGYAETFEELMQTTDWNAYGQSSGNPNCTDCMVHCGYEPTAVEQTFGSWNGFLKTALLTLFGPGKSKPQGPRPIVAEVPKPHFERERELVQLEVG
ncbi:adenosyl-hopene transferase HpnH [Calycomorphotria hydatis]|uniref:Cyclic pyranopterin monophosphate synthase n=1 Tax=Calycomorphotria hydatis TaxID=2528027 RepID=A0A517T3J2_9PLAN|nr:adenosyl-hopene transferase HpnH [Calycomorphotria hydatis]QDT62948.1 Cyclic pyranopterin monophosphate synthase [Calycomorphotria hydatis]